MINVAIMDLETNMTYFWILSDSMTDFFLFSSQPWDFAFQLKGASNLTTPIEPIQPKRSRGFVNFPKDIAPRCPEPERTRYCCGSVESVLGTRFYQP